MKKFQIISSKAVITELEKVMGSIYVTNKKIHLVSISHHENFSTAVLEAEPDTNLLNDIFFIGLWTGKGANI